MGRRCIPRPMGGLEPPTSGLAGRCSIQLSYMATSPPNTGNRESSGEPLGYTVIPLPPTKLRSRIGTLPTTATEQDEPPSRGVEPPPVGTGVRRQILDAANWRCARCER